MDDELDPRLRERLDALKEVPSRDPRHAAEGRARFLKMAAEMKPDNLPAQAVSSGLFWRLKKWLQPKPKFRKEDLKMVNILVAALMAISVIFGGGAAAAYASQDAVPGEALYPVKEMVEQAELSFTTDPQAKAELHLEFAQERAAEIQTLVAEGRADLIPQVVQNMQKHLGAAEQMAEQMSQRGQSEAAARVAVMTGVAAQRLQQAMAHADAHAQKALQLALQRTEAAQARAMEAYAEAQHHAEQAKNEAQQHAGEAMQQAKGEIFSLKGTVESIEGKTWVVDGQTVVVAEGAKVKGDVQVGDMVVIHGYVNADGQAVVVQASVLPNHPAPAKIVVFQGVVEAQTETQWVISGQTVNITPETRFHGNAQVGDRVMVVAEVQEDGSLQARVINLIARKGHGGQEIEPTIMPTQMPMPTMPLPTMRPTEMPTSWGGGMWGGNATATPEPGHDGGYEGGHH